MERFRKKNNKRLSKEIIDNISLIIYLTLTFAFIVFMNECISI